MNIDSNESWASLIKLILEKVNLGITQSTWKYKYSIDRPKCRDEVIYTYGEAISKNFSIHFSKSSSDYNFTVVHNEKEILSMASEPSSDDDAAWVEVSVYLKLLKSTQEEFIDKSALSILSELPD